jgi:ABC-type nitrate/sulfonate/bicarbonate transport system ATPase subunit/ABC-type transporter Mla maintaining outer membrane lipid asymmetry permease subunit MlaE
MSLATASKAEEGSSALVDVEGLCVALPGGARLLDDVALHVRPGTVVALLGPSGAGKSTLLRAIFAPEDLKRSGYQVSWSRREVASAPATVPQRGALLDHLDVAGNIELARAASGLQTDVASLLRAVELDSSFAVPGRSVSTLSGGQAQRVAVARTLAAARSLVVLDEPSVGLDPLGVRLLARLLVSQARQQGAGLIVVTHDLALAAGCADTIVFLDPSGARLVRPIAGWHGPAELDEPDDRQRRVFELESAVEDLLLGERPAPAAGARGTTATTSWLAPIAAAGSAVRYLFVPALFRESAAVLLRVLRQALLRPLGFYAIVGALLGLTVPYIIVHISDALKPAAVLRMIGGSYVLALAPPLSAIVFAATSGGAVSAWLGGLRLHGQVTALEGLAIAPARYLWAPSWGALVAAYLTTVFTFTLAMLVGGWSLFSFYGVPNAWSVITADFHEPEPGRWAYLVRGGWLAFAYALVMASVIVARSAEPKSSSDAVTASMTSTVMRCTLLVVVLELASIVVLFQRQGGS